MTSTGQNSGDDAKAVTKDQHKSSLLEKLDLDKNPIKYAQHDGILSTEAHDKSYMELVLRSGKHSEFVKKILRQRIEKRAQEFPRWPASQPCGVRVLWIESRFWYDRERLLPDFDDDWRSYRARYLHSLELDPREPVHVPEYERQLLNPIRRAYMKIGDFIEYKLIKPFVPGRWESAVPRVFITRSFIALAGGIALFYWARYNTNTWERHHGLQISVSAPFVYPGDLNYPFKNHREIPQHHYDVGFSERNIYTDLRDFEDVTCAL